MRNDVVLGYRAWRINPLNSALLGPVLKTEWPDGDCLKAECKEGFIPGTDPSVHESPGDSCMCGIYGFHEFDATVGSYAANAMSVIGPALYWGNIQVYTNGFKAQYARALAICDHKDIYKRFNPAKDYIDPKIGEWEEILEAVVARYSIPLLPYDLVVNYALTWARPLGVEIDE